MSFTHGSTPRPWENSEGSFSQEYKDLKELASMDNGKKIEKMIEGLKTDLQGHQKLQKSHNDTIQFYKWLKQTYQRFSDWNLTIFLNPRLETILDQDIKDSNTKFIDTSSVEGKRRFQTGPSGETPNEVVSLDDGNPSTPQKNLMEDFDMQRRKKDMVTKEIWLCIKLVAQALRAAVAEDNQHLVKDISFSFKERGMSPAALWARIIEEGLHHPEHLANKLRGELEYEISAAFKLSSIDDVLIRIDDILEFIAFLSHGQEVEFPSVLRYIKKALSSRSSFIQMSFISANQQRAFACWKDLRQLFRRWTLEDATDEDTKAPTALSVTTVRQAKPSKPVIYPCAYCSHRVVEGHWSSECPEREEDRAKGIYISGREGSYNAKKEAAKKKAEETQKKKKSEETQEALSVSSPPGGASIAPEQAPAVPKITFKTTEEMKSHLAEYERAAKEYYASKAVTAKDEQESAFLMVGESLESDPVAQQQQTALSQTSHTSINWGERVAQQQRAAEQQQQQQQNQLRALEHQHQQQQQKQKQRLRAAEQKQQQLKNQLRAADLQLQNQLRAAEQQRQQLQQQLRAAEQQIQQQKAAASAEKQQQKAKAAAAGSGAATAAADLVGAGSGTPTPAEAAATAAAESAAGSGKPAPATTASAAEVEAAGSGTTASAAAAELVVVGSGTATTAQQKAKAAAAGSGAVATAAPELVGASSGTPTPEEIEATEAAGSGTTASAAAAELVVVQKEPRIFWCRSHRSRLVVISWYS